MCPEIRGKTSKSSDHQSSVKSILTIGLYPAGVQIQESLDAIFGNAISTAGHLVG